MKYIITQKNIYEIVANNREDAVKMMKASTPSSSISVEELKEIPDYSELKNMMTGIKDITPNKVQKVLDKIKNELTPRVLALRDFLIEAKKNGLRVNDYLHYPERDYGFGIDGALIYKTGAEWPDEKFWYIDYRGDVYSSNYNCNYKDGSTYFSSTFKIGKGSPEYEESNQRKLCRLNEIYSRFDEFEQDVISDIKNQLVYKMSQK